MFQLFLRLTERKILDPNGPYISMSQTKNKKFMSFKIEVQR